MAPNDVQLRVLFEILRQDLRFQWRTRYLEVLPSGIIVIIFEQATNNNWRCLYTIPQNGKWKRRELYV